MSNVIMIEYVQSVCITEHSKMKQSPEVGPRIEPTNGFLLSWQMIWMF